MNRMIVSRWSRVPAMPPGSRGSVSPGAWTLSLLLGVAVCAPGMARAADSNRCAALLKTGEDHLAAWRVTEARAAFAEAETAARTGAERAEARLLGGHARYYAGRYAEARDAYAGVDGIAGRTPDQAFYARQYAGHAWLQEEDFARAVGAYRDLVRAGARPTLLRNARNDLAFAFVDWLNRAQARCRLGDLPAALAEARKLAAEPDAPDRERTGAWLVEGACLLQQKDGDGARAAFGRVLDFRAVPPQTWQVSSALAGIARSYEAEGHPGAALKAWRRLLAQPGAQPNRRAEALERARALGDGEPAPDHELDRTYGAECNPTGQPIGGGAGYTETVTNGAVEVGTAEDLLDALRALGEQAPEARAGKVVYVRPGAELNLAGRAGIVVPSGVTLAGNRGAGGAPGPLLFTDKPLAGFTWFAVGDGARVTGLRLRGDAAPFSVLFGMWPYSYWDAEKFLKTGWTITTVTAITTGDRVRVDNCEIGRFARGISVGGDANRIQHNTLYDISPYPIVMGGVQPPLIEGNRIDWVWHAIATSDDMLAGYEARYNEFREFAPNLWGQGISGQFALDHHGLGERFVVHHNTFRHLNREEGVPNRAVCLAPPWDLAQVNNNWFADTMTADEATYWLTTLGPVKTLTNLIEIVTKRDLSPYAEAYLKALPNDATFDLRQVVAMTRGGVGGENLWIYNNAYGPDRGVLPVTLFATPRIRFFQPVHGQPRTSLGHGRGGATNPALRHWRGRVPVLLEVELLPGLALKEVTVEFVSPDPARLLAGGYAPREADLRRLFAGPAAPEPGALVLDTQAMPNGIYGLRAAAEDQRGIRAHHLIYFAIVNPAPETDRR